MNSDGFSGNMVEGRMMFKDAVEQQQRRRRRQRSRDFQLSLLPVRQISRELIPDLFQAEYPKKLLRFLAHRRYRLIIPRSSENTVRQRTFILGTIFQPYHYVADNTHILENTNILKRPRDPRTVDHHLALSRQLPAVQIEISRRR